MIRAGAALLCAALFAAPAAARDPRLSLPVDCTLGDDCFIQYHVDRDPSPGAADFTCGSRSYDGHDGTDIALPSLRAMEQGVDVTAAAPGTVLRLRDGVPDRSVDDASDVADQECGNGVVVDHGGGWQTQYCHLKQGSLQVSPGQRVTASTVLGQVGLSGLTQFPHLHFTVRDEGAVIDPFSSDILPLQCGEPPAATLWQYPIAYTETGLIAAGFAPAVPDYGAVKAGTAGHPTLASDAPGLVIWAYGFASAPGDEIRFRVTGPAGTVLDSTATLDKTQAQYFRATGKRTRAPWPPGRYEGTATLVRDGEPVAARTASTIIE